MLNYTSFCASSGPCVCLATCRLLEGIHAGLLLSLPVLTIGRFTVDRCVMLEIVASNLLVSAATHTKFGTSKPVL